ncbi:WD40 repeat-like protein, partial [Dendrothele bispora CBS 962.96]
MMDANTGDLVYRPVKAHPSAVKTIAFSPDGQTFISGGETSILMWNTNTGLPIGPRMQLRSASVFCLKFSPDGKYFACGAYLSSTLLWDAVTGDKIGEIPHEGFFAFTPDSKQIIVMEGKHKINVWDIATLTKIGEPIETTDFFWCFAVSPDGKTLVTIAEWLDKVEFWDLASRQRIGEPLIINMTRLTYLNFSPDGTKLLCCNQYKVLIWDVETRTYIGKIWQHSGKISAMAFSIHGNKLVTGSEDETVRVWDVD